MRIVKIVFSPAGGTKRVVDMLAEALTYTAAEIDLTDIRETAPTQSPCH